MAVSKVMKAIAFSAFAGSWALLFSACEPTSSGFSALQEAFPPSDPSVVRPPLVAPGCFYDRYKQPDAQITGDIDLLFVTHTTDSFLSVRSSVVDGLDYFVSHIPQTVNYRIGILLAHGRNSCWSGLLYNADGHPAVLDSTRLSQGTIRSELAYNMTHTVQDPDTEGGEEGLASVYRALDSDRMAQNKAKGFFRPNAALAVLFMANEADICGLPSTDPGTDDDWAEEWAINQRTCSGVSPLSVYNKLKASRNGAPMQIGAAVYTNKNQPPIQGTEAEYGWGYMDIVSLASGMTINLANAQYNAGLAMLGDMLTVKLNLKTDFTLSHTGVDPKSVNVHVDGKDTPFAYHLPTNEVHVDKPGKAGSTVDILYCPAPSPSPSPSPCVGPLCGPPLGA